MKNLLITAHLASTFVAYDPWSPSIDGILAYWLMRERLGADVFDAHQGKSSQMLPVEGLPLERVEHDGLWWWACSSPIYEEQAKFLRYFHRRFDTDMATQFMEPLKKKILVTAGPFKNFRLSTLHHVTPRVQWHAIGEREEIQRLLSRCGFIGAKYGAGNGRVTHWTVAEEGDERLARFHRALPVDFAEKVGVRGKKMLWGIRPPARIPANVCECVMPSGSIASGDENGQETN